jgi:hypothetical protein
MPGITCNQREKAPNLDEALDEAPKDFNRNSHNAAFSNIRITESNLDAAKTRNLSIEY